MSDMIDMIDLLFILNKYAIINDLKNNLSLYELYSEYKYVYYKLFKVHFFSTLRNTFIDK